MSVREHIYREKNAGRTSYDRHRGENRAFKGRGKKEKWAETNLVDRSIFGEKRYGGKLRSLITSRRKPDCWKGLQKGDPETTDLHRQGKGGNSEGGRKMCRRAMSEDQVERKDIKGNIIGN